LLRTAIGKYDFGVFLGDQRRIEDGCRERNDGELAAVSSMAVATIAGG
jgi:hypothetical protein